MRSLDSARITSSVTALIGLISGLSGGCIVLVNEVSDAGGGGGNATSTSSTTVASTSGTGGGGGEPITCPGVASISTETLVSPANATIDDVVVRGDQVIFAARGEIDPSVTPGTVPAFVVYATPSLTTIQKRQLAADNSGGTIYSPLAVLDEDQVVVHSAGTLIRVRDDADPVVGDFTPSAVLRLMKAHDGILYGVGDGVGGPVVAMTLNPSPFEIANEEILHDPGGTYVEAFDVADGILAWADAGPGAPAFCSVPGCGAPITITSPPNTTAVAIGAGRGFSLAPAFGRMPPNRVYAFDFVQGTALPAFSVRMSAADQGAQAIAVIENTVAFTRRPDNSVPLDIIRCCATGPIEMLEQATCTVPAAIAGTEGATTRKIVAGPGPYAATMLFDHAGGQSIVVASWQPSP